MCLLKWNLLLGTFVIAFICQFCECIKRKRTSGNHEKLLKMNGQWRSFWDFFGFPLLSVHFSKWKDFFRIESFCASSHFQTGAHTPTQTDSDSHRRRGCWASESMKWIARTKEVHLNSNYHFRFVAIFQKFFFFFVLFLVLVSMPNVARKIHSDRPATQTWFINYIKQLNVSHCFAFGPMARTSARKR